MKQPLAGRNKSHYLAFAVLVSPSHSLFQPPSKSSLTLSISGCTQLLVGDLQVNKEKRGERGEKDVSPVLLSQVVGIMCCSKVQ